MKVTRWSQRFFTSTRGRILRLLRRDERTVNDLAKLLGLTDNAVRAHLSSLERDGLVQQSGSRPGFRKPQSAYKLASEAEYLFPKAYGLLLRQVLDVLSERLAPPVLDEVFHEVGRRIAAAQPPPQGATLQDRLQKAVELLNAFGGLAELEQDPKRLCIRGYRCPLAAAVAGHPQACHIVETLLTELVGVPFRTCCQPGDPPQCCFEAAPPAPST